MEIARGAQHIKRICDEQLPTSMNRSLQQRWKTLKGKDFMVTPFSLIHVLNRMGNNWFVGSTVVHK